MVKAVQQPAAVLAVAGVTISDLAQQRDFVPCCLRVVLCTLLNLQQKHDAHTYSCKAGTLMNIPGCYAPTAPSKASINLAVLWSPRPLHLYHNLLLSMACEHNRTVLHHAALWTSHYAWCVAALPGQDALPCWYSFRTLSAAKLWVLLSRTNHTVLKWPHPSFFSTT